MSAANIGFLFPKFDARLNFEFEIWSKAEDRYYETFSDESKKNGYKDIILTIKGTYLYERDDESRKKVVMRQT